MFQKIINWSHYAHDIILDYRYKVDKKAGVIFAYYFTMSIVPIFSLLAFFSTMFNVPLDYIELYLSSILSDDLAALVLDRLTPPEFSFTTVFILCMSVYIVSRCVLQIYNVSKNMYPPMHTRSWFVEVVLSIIKTVGIFLLLVMVVLILTISPILKNSFGSGAAFGLDDLILFIIIFVVLWLLYNIIPDVRVELFDVTMGSASASLLMWLLIKVLQFYFSMANYTNVYGPLATVVMILMSISILAEVIYIGLYVMFEAHMYREILALRNEPTLGPKHYTIVDQSTNEVIGEAMSQEEVEQLLLKQNEMKESSTDE